MSFSAYPIYKDSGVEWLGEVPSHWTPTRLRFLTQLNPSKIEVGEIDPKTEVSFVPMEAVGERGELSLGQTRPLGAVLTGYTYFREGDVSIAKITPCFENGKGAIMRGLLGGVGFGTTEFIVARARPDAITPPFLDWLFRSTAFRSRGEAAMYGAGGQKRVPDNFVRDFISPGAPIDEQAAIATFLDRETAKIDALIEEQCRLIVLLKEKQQAIISNAVTKGLDPHVPLADSGIEWLGEVPAHWKVMALRRLTDPARPITYGIVQPGESDPQGRFMVRGQDYSRGWVSGEDIFRVSDAVEVPYRRARLQTGDVVITIVGAGTGNTAVVPPFLAGANITQTTARVAPLSNLIRGDYLATLMASRLGAVQVALYQKGAAQPGLNLEHLAAFRFPMPPQCEQTEILERISPVLRQMQELTRSAGQAMTLLKERRAALISAAVTGRIDVRESDKVLLFPIDRVRARGLIAAEIIERSAHQATFGRVKLQKIAFLTEAHVGVGELGGSYTREAAGPLDRVMIDEMENGAQSIIGITVDQAAGTGTTVIYRLGRQRGAHRKELADWLGADRTARLDKLIADFAALTTKSAEAVATLYSVWNDAIIEGASPSEEDIISGFLNDWHPEKQRKFRADELPEWLNWMRRHGIVPTGTGPKTVTGRLFT